MRLSETGLIKIQKTKRLQNSFEKKLKVRNQETTTSLCNYQKTEWKTQHLRKDFKEYKLVTFCHWLRHLSNEIFLRLYEEKTLHDEVRRLQYKKYDQLSKIEI